MLFLVDVHNLVRPAHRVHNGVILLRIIRGDAHRNPHLLPAVLPEFSLDGDLAALLEVRLECIGGFAPKDNIKVNPYFNTSGF